MAGTAIEDGNFCFCNQIKTKTHEDITLQQPVRESGLLRVRSLCETRSGDLAFVMGRLRLSPGRPMLVEHLGGLYLEHDMTGRVLTGGYGSEFDIMHLLLEEA